MENEKWKRGVRKREKGKRISDVPVEEI